MNETELESEKDIVDHLSEATGYFHDSEAAKLRDIAEASGQKPVGVVRAAVEKEIERREWKCVHFEHNEADEYPSWNAFEYYRIHKSLQQEYEAAIEALPTEENQMLREVHVLETAYETVRDKAREHRAKAETAERYLEENGEDPDEVLGK
jgi:hypothetical protein